MLDETKKGRVMRQQLALMPSIPVITFFALSIRVSGRAKLSSFLYLAGVVVEVLHKHMRFLSSFSGIITTGNKV